MPLNDNIPVVQSLPQDSEKTTLQTLPEELRVQILQYVVPFEKDKIISHYTWKRLRKEVDSLLYIKGLQKLALDHFYNFNTVCIKPSRIGNSNFMCRYPSYPANKAVRKLEIHVKVWSDDKYQLPVIRWLQRLANLQIGFNKLNILRIILIPMDSPCPSTLDKFFSNLESFGPIDFETNQFDVVVRIQSKKSGEAGDVENWWSQNESRVYRTLTYHKCRR